MTFNRSQYGVWAAVAVAGTLLVGSVAMAATPEGFLKTKTTRLQALLAKPTVEGTAAHQRKKNAIIKLLRTMLNYTELAKRSLWKHWAARSGGERREFVSLLKQLIEERVLSNLNGQTEFTVEWGETTTSGRTAAVKTTVRVPNKPEIEIEYKMIKRGSRWAIWDVITDGTSLVRNYRSQFNKIIVRDGYQALVDKMKDKLQKQESSGKVANAVEAG